MRPTTLLLATLATGLLLAASAATAGSGECGQAKNVVQHIFDAADSNGDGQLSPAEYEQAGLEGYGVSFDEYDIDENGLTSFDEYLALYERYHAPEGSIGT